MNYEQEAFRLLLLQQLFKPLQTVAVVGVVKDQKDSFALAGERSLSDLFVGLLGHFAFMDACKINEGFLFPPKESI